MEARRFRADLYYRLQVLTILLPPLRDRRDEIPSLAAALLPRGATLSPGASGALLEYRWPGNIRELRNTLWRASILADGTPIRPEHLGIGSVTGDAPAPADPDRPRTLAEAEQQAIAAALRTADGNRTRAAELLGIARSTLQEKLRKHPELG